MQVHIEQTLSKAPSDANATKLQPLLSALFLFLCTLRAFPLTHSRSFQTQKGPAQLFCTYKCLDASPEKEHTKHQPSNPYISRYTRLLLEQPSNGNNTNSLVFRTQSQSPVAGVPQYPQRRPGITQISPWPLSAQVTHRTPGTLGLAVLKWVTDCGIV
jgi:hypothetical protein